MSRFPISLDMEDGQVLVAGRGHLAHAKIRLLLATGIRVSAFVFDDQKIEQEFSDQITILKGDFKSEYIKSAKLLYIAGTNAEELRLLITEAKRVNVPYNHVDDPENSNFSTPAMVKRGSLTVAISTDGKAPVLSRNIRRKVDQLLPEKLGELIELTYQYRAGVNKIITRAADKLKFWNRIYSDGEISRLLSLDTASRKQRILGLVTTLEKHPENGHVLIVGAGPGDPELLTLKAHRALQEADVIIYDNLVSDGVLDLARRDAERIYVGKKRSQHFKNQDQINRIIVEHAKKGLLVVRLKGGDPTVFGRVAEEIDALKQNNISFKIIPGITAAAGIAASTAIPLTHRDLASSVTYATGQLKDGKTQDWSGFAGDKRTIVIYMGINSAAKTSKSLIEDGFLAKTPIAIIENGTCDNERRLYGTLEELGDLVVREDVKSPALLIVGDVVTQASDYAYPSEQNYQLAI